MTYKKEKHIFVLLARVMTDCEAPIFPLRLSLALLIIKAGNIQLFSKITVQNDWFLKVVILLAV